MNQLLKSCIQCELSSKCSSLLLFSFCFVKQKLVRIKFKFHTESHMSSTYTKYETLLKSLVEEWILLIIGLIGIISNVLSKLKKMVFFK